MATKLIRVGAELDRQTDEKFGKWATSEGRSKRRHAAVVIGKLIRLRETHGPELARLGLIDPTAAAALAVG